MFKPFSSVTKCFKMILILLGSSLLNSSITFSINFKFTKVISSSQMLRFLFSCYWTNICRDLRDCPAGRESRSVPTLFVSRGTGTGTEVCGTSGTGTEVYGTVPSRPLPIPALDQWRSFLIHIQEVEFILRRPMVAGVYKNHLEGKY